MLLEHWRKLVDVTVVMTVDPDTAITRENEHLIIRRVGSMMNTDALKAFNTALEAAATKHQHTFRLIRLESQATIREANTDLARRLLDEMRNFADPKVVAVPRRVVDQEFGGRDFIAEQEGLQVLERLTQNAVIDVRSSVEKHVDLVQLVACGLLRAEGRYFVLRRTEKDEKSRKYGERTLWKGCHVESDEAPSRDRIEKCLQRRLLDDLHLAEFPKPEFLGLARAEHDGKPDNHLGIMFEFEIESDQVIASLEKKELRRSGRAQPLEGTIKALHELSRDQDDLGLEKWSRAVLRAKQDQP